MRVLLATSRPGMRPDIGLNNLPSVGLYRIKAYLDENGHHGEVWDYVLEDGDPDASLLSRFSIIGISVSNTFSESDLLAIHQLRQQVGPRVLIVVGGQEATFNPVFWLNNGADLAVLGYGELPMLRLAEAFEHGWEAGWAKVPEMPGLARLQDGKLVSRHAEELTAPLFQELTFGLSKRLAIPFERYWEKARKVSAAVNVLSNTFIAETVPIYTASRCPNHCGFCSSHIFLDVAQGSVHKALFLNASQILDIMTTAYARHGARAFYFSDDEFLLHKQRMRELSPLIVQARADGRLAPDTMIFGQARVTDFMTNGPNGRVADEAFARCLQAAGLRGISLGVESFSDRLLTSPSMDKGTHTASHALQVLRMANRIGLTPRINLVLLPPESTEDELRATIDQALELVLEGCQLGVNVRYHDASGIPFAKKPGYRPIPHRITTPLGVSLEIPGYVEPHDPRLADLAHHYEDEYAAELANFHARLTVPLERVSRQYVGLISVITIATHLGWKDRETYWRGLLADWISRARSNAA